MSEIEAFLEAARDRLAREQAIQDEPSDGMLSRWLGVSPQRVSTWRKGMVPKQDDLIRLGERAGRSRDECVLIWGYLRAERDGQPEAAAQFKEILARIARVAVPGILAAMLFIPATSSAYGHAAGNISRAYGIYYGKWRRWLERLDFPGFFGRRHAHARAAANYGKHRRDTRCCHGSGFAAVIPLTVRQVAPS